MNRSRRGFTLIELLIVVAIMAIIAAVAVPVLVGSADRGKEDAIHTEVNTCYKKVVEAVQYCGTYSTCNKANVLEQLNNAYVGVTHVKKVDISQGSDGLYNIVITDSMGKTHSKVFGNVTWDVSEVKYDASHPLTVTLTVGENGRWQ